MRQEAFSVVKLALDADKHLTPIQILKHREAADIRVSMPSLTRALKDLVHLQRVRVTHTALGARYEWAGPPHAGR